MKCNLKKVKIGVYLINNTINNKKYVGSSVDIRIRWYGHRLDLLKNRHTNPHLQHAWNKYGEKRFEFSIIEETSIEDLIKKEQYWIDHYRSNITGYNIADTAGTFHPPSTKIEIKGVVKTLPEWCRMYDMNKGTVWIRHKKYGWTWEEAIKTPLHGKQKQRHKKTCERCQSIFFTSANDAKYCNTKSCRALAARLKRTPKPRKIHDCICQICNILFKSKVKKAKCCSQKCRYKKNK